MLIFISTLLMKFVGPTKIVSYSFNDGQCIATWNLMYDIGKPVANGMHEVHSANVPAMYQDALYYNRRPSIYQGLAMPNGSVRIISMDPKPTWRDCEDHNEQNDN